MTSAEEVRKLLSYDPLTGVFSWRQSGKGRNSGAAGAVGGNGYRQITIRGRKYQAHRLAVLYVSGRWPVGDVDHINGDRDDNRVANLRSVSRALNMQNQHVIQSRSKSGVRGVSWHVAAAKWAARIGKIHLGLFDSIEEAASARVKAELAYFVAPVSEFA